MPPGVGKARLAPGVPTGVPTMAFTAAAVAFQEAFQCSVDFVGEGRGAATVGFTARGDARGELAQALLAGDGHGLPVGCPFARPVPVISGMRALCTGLAVGAFKVEIAGTGTTEVVFPFPVKEADLSMTAPACRVAAIAQGGVGPGVAAAAAAATGGAPKAAQGTLGVVGGCC